MEAIEKVLLVVVCVIFDAFIRWASPTQAKLQ